MPAIGWIIRFRHTIRGLMILVLVAALALAWVTGRQRPQPFPVSGTVTFNGQPLAQGQISFVPKNPTGTTAASPIVVGKYSLTSFVLNDRALPGAYDVVVVSPIIPAKYQSQATSPMSAQIQKSANLIDLDLR
jgi:hypothetical protein